MDSTTERTAVKWNPHFAHNKYCRTGRTGSLRVSSILSSNYRVHSIDQSAILSLRDVSTRFQDILIKKGIVEKDDVLRGKGIDPDELRLEEAIVSPVIANNVYLITHIQTVEPT